MKKGNITGIVDDSGTNVTIDFDDDCTLKDMMKVYAHITARVLDTLVKVDNNESSEEEILAVLGQAVSIGVDAYFKYEENPEEKESEALS